MRTATLTIDPAAITHNLAQVHVFAPKAKILAMVKANAYGHGIAAVLPALDQADGVGVATFEEALEARHLGWAKTIGLVEGVFSASEWRQAIDNEFSCVIHHAPQLEWALNQIPPEGSQTRLVWLKYNSGMNRLGFNSNDLIKAATALNQAGYQLILTTHFANADAVSHPLNALQIERFNALLEILRQDVSPDIQASLCNSAGIIHFAQCHQDWVRPGIMLYGSSPVNDKSAAQLNLQPAMTFSTEIMAFQTVTAGDAIGYSSRWIAQQETRTALVSIGYGDGYPRIIDEHAEVCVILTQVDGSKVRYFCPIRGRVAMDMIVIDISATPKDLPLNSEVILWGEAPHIDEVAASAGTISYELFCRLSLRPNRVLKDSLATGLKK